MDCGAVIQLAIEPAPRAERHLTVVLQLRSDTLGLFLQAGGRL